MRRLRVVELGGGAAGALTGMALADQGAEVVRVSSPNDLPVPWDGWLRGRIEVGHCDPAPFVERADVVIDAGTEAVGLPRNPATVWCRLHGGGLPPVEGLIAARTALYEPPIAVRPRFHPFPIATMVASCWALNGVMAALIARDRDGRGQRVRVSLEEAAVSSLELMALFQDRPPTAFQPLHWVASPFVALHPCAEGHLFVHLGLAAHLHTFLDGLGEAGGALRAVLSEATLRDPGAPGSVREAARARRELRAVLATRTALSWEADFPGLCLGAVRSPAAWRDSPVAQSGGHVVSLGGEQVPGPAVGDDPVRDAVIALPEEVLDRWPSLPAPHGDDRRPALAGVRVLDLTAVIAGPVAGRTLAELGADVVRLDNPWMRPAWSEAFHALFDRGKRGAWLDLSVPGGQAALAELIREHPPDILVQNYRPGVLERLGLASVAPHTVGISAFGALGEWGRRPGWEQTAQAACGVQHLYGGPGTPELFPAPIHDLCTGLFASYGALCALWWGGDAEVSLARTSTLLQSAAMFGGHDAPDGWERHGRQWVFCEQGVEQARRKLPAVLADSVLVRREVRPDLGSFTRIDSPLHLGRTPVVEGESAPRGAQTFTLLGRQSPAPSSPPSRRRWWLGRVRWALAAGLLGCSVPEPTAPTRWRAPLAHEHRARALRIEPGVRFPSPGAGATAEVWLSIPEGARIGKETLSNGQAGLLYPPGTVSERVERRGDRVIDVRGTRIDGAGTRWHHVYKPVSADPTANLVGAEWVANDPEALRLATTRLGAALRERGVPDSTIEAYGEKLDCDSCHVVRRPANTRPREYHFINRGTDSAGFFTPSTLLHQAVPLESYGVDQNMGQPFVQATCAEGEVVQRSGRPSCTGAQVPSATFDLVAALSQGDPHASAVQKSHETLLLWMEAP